MSERWDVQHVARRETSEMGIPMQNIGVCLSTPCSNNGTCIDGAGSYRCDCGDTSYAGPECETYVINECLGNPCENDGRCVDQIGGYSCNCAAGWTGQRCEVRGDHGFGTEVDMANPYLSDGTYKLKFAPIFSGDLITAVQMHTNPRTQIGHTQVRTSIAVVRTAGLIHTVQIQHITTTATGFSRTMAQKFAAATVQPQQNPDSAVSTTVYPVDTS
eukprot:SAG31_NODE_4484_length_3196_cov_1.689377_3_plen_216_part_00